MNQRRAEEEKENQPGKGDGRLSSISEVIAKTSLEKIKVTCRECGETFEATNLGPITRQYCDDCSQKVEEKEKEAELQAQERAEEERLSELISLAAIPPRWKKVSFATLDPKIQTRAQRIARRYAENFSRDSQSLVFYSKENGTGKTTMAACIANYVLHELKVPVMFAKARDVMLEIRKTFSDRYETEAQVLDKISYVDLLILDDVGVDSPSEWIKSTYWTLLDRRSDWELPVVVTTNRPFEGEGEILADRIGEGASSRLLGLCRGNIIEMRGEDLR